MEMALRCPSLGGVCSHVEGRVSLQALLIHVDRLLQSFSEVNTQPNKIQPNT